VRLLVRDHRSGEPLMAQIRVQLEEAAAERIQEHVSSREGRLELTLAPGRYTIQIKLHGYRKQRKTVTIEDQSVTMLDVALHARSKKK
jgi:hypothetical protein